MGILARFADIMKANINDLLDKCEDPAKMIDQTLRNLNENLADVKKETASIMALEKSAKRALDDAQDEITKWTDYAKKALTAGNEGDAKQFLAKKVEIESKIPGLTETYNTAKTNADNMRAMHDKLVKDINELNSRKDMIKGKLAVAETQAKINEMTGSAVSAANSSISAFERYEAKAEAALDKANAMEELNKGEADKLEDLTDKYDTGSATVDSELAALKASMGL